jgi:hypothetical protein
MDIQKPKPRGGWPEFLTEIGIIVIGVLIALGGQQLVEWIHQSQEIREARESIRDEIATNMTIAAYGMEERRCLKPYLDADKAWSQGGPRPTRYGLLTLPLRSSVWETVKMGPVAKMPLKERLALAEFYGWVANDQGALRDLRDDSLQLQSIWARSAGLDAETAGRLQEVVMNTRIMSSVLNADARVILAGGAALGVKPKARADLRPAELVEAMAEACVAPSVARPAS